MEKKLNNIEKSIALKFIKESGINVPQTVKQILESKEDENLLTQIAYNNINIIQEQLVDNNYETNEEYVAKLNKVLTMLFAEDGEVIDVLAVEGGNCLRKCP